MAVLLIPFALAAEERWIEIRSGPCEVVSNAGDRPAREVLNELEQVRYVLGTALGKDELKSTWPFRVLVSKGGGVNPPVLARDAYTGSVAAGEPIPPAWLREYVRLLLEANSGRMPAGMESGIEAFYSTAQAVGTKVTLGTAPPGERELHWARIHVLVTNPEFAGRMRVALYNLQRGADLEASFKNAFGKTPAEIDKLAAADMASGSAATVVIGGRPLDPSRDFHPVQVERPFAGIVAADVLLANGREARAAYQELVAAKPAEAHEGLGFVALAAKRTDEARKEFAAAVDAGSTSARAWVEAARLETDAAKARTELQKAAELNANWAEPHVLLAEREADPSRKLAELKTAAPLDPRNSARWTAVAELYQRHGKYSEAAKAWAAAEDASVDGAERDHIRQIREGIEEQRLEYEAAERRKREEERQRDLQRVKDASMAEIHAAEARANAGQKPVGKVEQMEIGQAPAGKAQGVLAAVECVGGMARLVVRSTDGKLTKLLVRNARDVAMLGGETAMKCGAQSPERRVVVEYQPKRNAKLGTAGEVVTVTYE